jgi:hypothetical protein
MSRQDRLPHFARAECSSSDERLRRWHRLFGLLLSEHLADSPFSVILEMDLSERQQFLDVVVVRRRPGPMTLPLPDGLDDLADHNLISSKTFWEALTDWTLKELTGHYVNYRKQVSPPRGLLPENQLRMIAVCPRRPRDLFAAVSPEPLRPGVYICRRGTDLIRVVVVASCRGSNATPCSICSPQLRSRYNMPQSIFGCDRPIRHDCEQVAEGISHRGVAHAVHHRGLPP